MKKYITIGVVTTLLTSSLALAMNMTDATTTMQDKKMDTKMMEAMDYEAITKYSTASDISKLQMMLVEKGHLKMPKNVKYGYYGNLTKKAFMKYKDAKMMMKDTMTNQ